MSDLNITQGRKGVVMTITPKLEVQIEGHNFTQADGPVCKTLSDKLRTALGGDLISEDLKPEFAELGGVHLEE